MIVSELIKKLQEFPQDYRVVIYPEEGWSDVVDVGIVFGDFVAIMNEDTICDKEKFK